MFGRFESRRLERNGETSDLVYHVALSKRTSPRKLIETKRSYWGAGNNPHWRRDATFDEDEARRRKDTAPQIPSIVRRTASPS